MPDDRVLPLDTEEILRVMDAAQVLQARKDRREEHEAFDRDAVIREIQIIYEGIGDLVDEDAIGRALDEYLEQRHAFVPRPPGLKATLAGLYIRRRALARRVLLPSGVAIAVLWSGWAAISWMQQGALTRDADNIDALAQSLTAEQQARTQLLESYRASPVASLLPQAEAAQLSTRLDAAAQFLAGARDRLDDYSASATTADVDAERVTASRGLILEVQRALGGADEELELARTWIDRQERLERADSRAERLIESVRGETAPQTLLDRSEQAYRAVAAALVQRDLAAAEEAVVQLEIAAGDVGRLPDLSLASARLANAVRTLAIEPQARDLGAQFEADARAFAAVGDIGNLSAVVTALGTLEARLSQEYAVVITGGVWRFRDEDRRVRNYYLIVEARDAAGRLVELEITNEETGRTETVSVWAERVPRATYDRVAADKQDNGIVDENEFATKRRGYEMLQRLFEDVGQITRW